ncbi:hypothetical protein [Methanolobus sp. WCC5]|jgi:hypothetical protein|uniref:hypothetical protein n=1 Tax=Methanolobus sp. WCC5 TaxID=3125785 RepID=UPI003248F3FB
MTRKKTCKTNTGGFVFSKEKNIFLNISKALYSLTHDLKEENPDASVDEWTFLPSGPCTGDVLDIKGKTAPGENIGMEVSFTLFVPVIDNRYEYVFKNIRIPGGSNSFRVRSQKVEDLNFIVRMFVDFKRSFHAEKGIAEFFEKNVPAGNYEIAINGNVPDGEKEVKIDFVATQTVNADQEGNFYHQYDTCSLPEGEFTVKIGNNEKIITLTPSD